MTKAELILGGSFAASVIGKLVEVGRSYLGDNYDLHASTRKVLTNLENHLPNIQIVIEAAEKRKINNKGVDTWLNQLKDAAYEAEDVLDDFEAKRIRRSIKGKGKLTEISSSSGKMVKSLIFPDKDLKKLESVVSKLDKLCMGDVIKTLQLTHIDKREEHFYNLGRETSSYLSPGVAIFGRDREIELILDMIFDTSYLLGGEGSSSLWDMMKSFLDWSVPKKPFLIDTVEKGDAPEHCKSRLTTTESVLAEPHSISNRKLAVISIVGVGGVGKTTVAKCIYNNERVREHFALRAWVYVSEYCDTKKIMQEILLSFESGIIDPFVNLENVRNKLKETITNHRFILILDDLRDRTELKWNDLRSVLCYGEVGSVVVVTTQSRIVANTIRTLPEVKLDVLQPKIFWDLFQYYAFAGFKLADVKDQPPLRPSEQEELIKIGKQIAEKLHGLPLAGQVIGTLLSTRLEREFWEDICESDWWNIEGARDNILPSIGVGYDYLDPELKQCFVYCSIFPKQYKFERERLVQMWIAEGFIQPGKEEMGRLDKGEIRLEDIGRKWFGKLVDGFFFQPTLSDGKYLMHDLLRDLAIAVSSNEFCFVKSHDENVPSVARHIGIGCDNIEVEWKCNDSTRLRTMMLFGNWVNCSAKSISNIFARFSGLRVLDLSYTVLETNRLNDTARGLTHLRFVDLSFTGIKSIPDAFCSLYHLQVLDVRGCTFKKLPKEMNQLINLRHLYASSHTISLISSIGKLTKLQELEEFRIGESKGHRISELKHMNEISGHLLLSNLNNVSSKEEAAEAQLDKKKYLKSLELRFEYNDHGPRTEVKKELLDALKPGRKLEILKVGGCRWESFPSWAFSPHHGSNNLKAIHVHSFRLSSIPAFGELPFLELLSFDDLPLIEKVGSEFYGGSLVIFPSLNELIFSRMLYWRKWEDGEAGKIIFPYLKKLHLKDCGALKTLPLYSLTSVVELALSGCSGICNIQTVLERMPSLAHFSITDLQSLFIGCTRLKSLEVLHLTYIHLVYFVGGLKYLVKLRELVIKNCQEIRHTYEEHPLDEISHEEYEKQCLQYLTYLHLCGSESLPRLGRLPSLHMLLIEKSFSSHYTGDQWFSQLTSLEELEFRNCQRLSCLPSTLHLLTSLKKLHISSCPELRSLPEKGLPENLAELYIEECPDLIRQCQPNRGHEWHKISHIPIVNFNGDIGTLQVRST